MQSKRPIIQFGDPMANIAHVVVLMLENRSFDCMLGRLYPKRLDFDGLKGIESNRCSGQDIAVWCSPEMSPQVACIPTPDPNELFADMIEQIFGVGNQPPAPATMGGFAQNYMKVSANDAKAVMHGFSPEQVPVLSARAKAFG